MYDLTPIQHQLEQVLLALGQEQDSVRHDLLTKRSVALAQIEAQLEGCPTCTSTVICPNHVAGCITIWGSYLQSIQPQH